MRFEDYIYREQYEPYICNVNQYPDEDKYILREQRRQKSKRTMLVITGICFIAIFLLLYISFFTQNEQKELVEDLPMEVVEAAVMAEESLQSIEEEVPEDFENEKIQEALIANATRIDNVKISHYCAEKYHHICNAGEPYKTALGHDVVPNLTCAVDPNIIPLGSTVFVDYGDGVIYEYFASDTGGGVNGNHIDVAVDTHDYALECGLKNATVWWTKE